MNEYSYQERHMGTDVSLSFVCDEREVAAVIAAETFATIHDYELRFSRFLPDSELSRLNTEGTRIVSPEFVAVLEKCITLHTLTAGAFNPLVQVTTLGYTRTFKTLADTTPELSPAVYDTDLQKIAIDRTTNTITLANDQKLDLGGVLKGYLATKLADAVVSTYPACTGVIINIGGDVATRGYDALHKPFIFLLYNPVTGEEVSTILTDTALATSGTYARSWQTSTGRQHHIVDATRLQNPVNNVVSASIIHYDGAGAEALTKLFLVHGITAALTLLPPEKQQYRFFAVTSDGNVSTNIV